MVFSGSLPEALANTLMPSVLEVVWQHGLAQRSCRVSATPLLSRHPTRCLTPETVTQAAAHPAGQRLPLLIRAQILSSCCLATATSLALSLPAKASYWLKTKTF